MSKLPILTAKGLIGIRSRMGFSINRQRGSHVFLKDKAGRTTRVPVHSNETIDRGLLNKIIKKDPNISREEFMKYL